MKHKLLKSANDNTGKELNIYKRISKYKSLQSHKYKTLTNYAHLGLVNIGYLEYQRRGTNTRSVSGAIKV